MTSGSGSGDAPPSWPLVVPLDVELLALEMLSRRHDEHLAAHERRHGVDVGTVERIRTWGNLVVQGSRLASDKLPAVLLGYAGLAQEEPTRTEDDLLDIEHLFALEVSASGTGRLDTLRRRDWYGWTVLECLLQRLPRSGVVNAVRIRDVEPVEYQDRGAFIATLRALVQVTIPGAMSHVGPGADDDTDWFAPVTATAIEVTVERE